VEALAEFDKALSLYQEQDIFVPDQEETIKMIKYVYASNKME